MTRTIDAALIISGSGDSDYELSEGVIWDHVNQRWLIVLIPACKLLVLDSAMNLIETVDIRAMLKKLGAPASAGEFLAAVQLDGYGNYLLVLGNGICRLSQDLKTLSDYRQLHDLSDTRFNDAVTLSDGTILITSLNHCDWLAHAKGGMFALSPDGSFNCLEGDIGLGNGMIQLEALGDARFVILWHDSHECYTQKAIVDLESGDLEETVPWRQCCDGRNPFSDEIALPDGLTSAINASGVAIAIVAEWGCGRVTFVNVDTLGAELIVNLPDGVARPTNATLGGPKGEDLVITSESTGDGVVENAGVYHANVLSYSAVDLPISKIPH